MKNKQEIRNFHSDNRKYRNELFFSTEKHFLTSTILTIFVLTEL